jgi:hypothetical protein
MLFPLLQILLAILAPQKHMVVLETQCSANKRSYAGNIAKKVELHKTNSKTYM